MIIDAHSHIGNERFNKRDCIEIADYINFADKVGIDLSLIMPVPCPVTPKHCWDFEEGKIILSWKYQDERHIYYSEIF